MSKAIRDIKLLMIFFGKLDSVPVSVRFASFSKVDSYIVNRSADYTNQLALWMFFLIVQST